MLRPAVLILAFIGLAAALLRTFSVVDSHTRPGGAVPEISRLDSASIPAVADLIGMDRSSPEYAEIERENRLFLRKFNQFPGLTLVHVLPAALFAILAPLQFSRKIRSRHLRWHRWSGRLIVAIAIPMGLSGLYFGARMPFSGPAEGIPVVLFGCLFLFSLVRAFVAIRAGQIAVHREWMIRMFGVALAVSVQRVAAIILALATLKGPATWFAPSIWIGFLLSCGVAEWWIRRSRRLGIPAEIAILPSAGAGHRVRAAS